MRVDGQYMNVRIVAVGVAVVLFGLVVTNSGEASEARRDVLDRQDPERLQDIRAMDEDPDVRSLTPEERRKRTLRRKLRRVDELMAKGAHEEGAALLESLRVGRSEQDFAHVQNTLAFAYSQSDQPEKAIRYYERALSIPGAPAAVQLSARRQLAGLYYGQGREQLWDEDAAQWYRRALSTMERWIGAGANPAPKDYFFLSRIQLELNDLDGSMVSLETAIRIADERGVPVDEQWADLLERMKSASAD